MDGSMTQSNGPGATVGATRVEALYYRSLRHVSQPLEGFQVLVGPNASGKSNFLDVLAFLGDVLITDLDTALLGDDRLDIPLRATDGRDLVWSGRRPRLRSVQPSFELAVEMAIPEHLLASASSNRTVCRYEVKINVTKEPTFDCETFYLTRPGRSAEVQRQLFPQPRTPPSQIALAPGEHAPAGWKRVVSRGREPERVNFRSERSGWTAPFRIAPWESALANLPADDERFPVALWFRERMRGAQRMVLSGEAMRSPCPPIRLNDYLPDGSNLPHVVQRLAESYPEQHERWIKHVREALPDIVGIGTRERDEDRHRYLVLEHSNGQETPSWLVSDGTLRLLALTLLAYLPDLSGMYLIEEPENGLHPRAVETVFQSLSSVYEAQVLLTTHSPLIARLASPDELLCVARDDQTGTDIVTGSDHPLLRDWQGEADLGTLFASGVLG